MEKAWSALKSVVVDSPLVRRLSGVNDHNHNNDSIGEPASITQPAADAVKKEHNLLQQQPPTTAAATVAAAAAAAAATAAEDKDGDANDNNDDDDADKDNENEEYETASEQMPPEDEEEEEYMEADEPTDPTTAATNNDNDDDDEEKVEGRVVDDVMEETTNDIASKKTTDTASKKTSHAKKPSEKLVDLDDAIVCKWFEHGWYFGYVKKNKANSTSVMLPVRYEDTDSETLHRRDIQTMLVWQNATTQTPFVRIPGGRKAGHYLWGLPRDDLVTAHESARQQQETQWEQELNKLPLVDLDLVEYKEINNLLRMAGYDENTPKEARVFVDPNGKEFDSLFHLRKDMLVNGVYGCRSWKKADQSKIKAWVCQLHLQQQEEGALPKVKILNKHLFYYLLSKMKIVYQHPNWFAPGDYHWEGDLIMHLALEGVPQQFEGVSKDEVRWMQVFVSKQLEVVEFRPAKRKGAKSSATKRSRKGNDGDNNNKNGEQQRKARRRTK